MTTSLVARDKNEAKKKGMIALGTGVGAGALFAVGWPLVGTAAAASAAYFTYKWFMFRAKRGMRF